MSDLLVALGLVLVLEGILWAAFPKAAHHMLKIASSTPETSMRIGGTVAILLGVLVVWTVRG